MFFNIDTQAMYQNVIYSMLACSCMIIHGTCMMHAGHVSGTCKVTVYDTCTFLHGIGMIECKVVSLSGMIHMRFIHVSCMRTQDSYKNHARFFCKILHSIFSSSF